MNRRTLVMILAVMAAGFATVSTAEAGGGGGKTKKNVIYVVNQQFANAPPVAQNVIWLPAGQAPLTTVPAITNLATFLAKGGHVLAPGGSTTFPNVAPGSGNVFVLDSVFVATGSAPYTVKSGTQLLYTVEGVDLTGTIRQLP